MNSKMNASTEWYAVSGASDLPCGSARAVMLQGEDIVIWRTTSGVAQAWQNRCLHRGMRLSFGQVRGEQLSCRYHGWLFDKSGKCVRMPAQPALKPAASLCMSGYGCEQKRGLIWINLKSNDSSALDNALNDNGVENEWIFCKSLYLGLTPNEVQSQLTNVNFPLFSEQQSAVTNYHSNQPQLNTIIITANNNDARDMISLTIQPISTARTAIHLCTTSTGDQIHDQSKRLHYHRWARRLRWFLQNPAAQYDGIHPLKITKEPLHKSASGV